jgi:hypothetical protein
MTEVHNPFDPDQPIQYTPPSEEAIPMMLDGLGEMMSIQNLLLYRIYDLLSVVAYHLDERTTRAVIDRHDRGELISRAAWFNERQNDAGQE